MASRSFVRAWPLIAALVATTALHAEQADTMPPRDTLPPATLIGRVTDSTGVGLPGAEISLHKLASIRTITGDSGDFRITGVPSGTAVFNARRLGFQAASFTAVLKPGKTHRATFSLTATAQELPTVAVADTANKSHWLDQFERRKSGSRGTFITRAEIL